MKRSNTRACRHIYIQVVITSFDGDGGRVERGCNQLPPKSWVVRSHEKGPLRMAHFQEPYSQEASVEQRKIGGGQVVKRENRGAFHSLSPQVLLSTPQIKYP